MVAQNHHKTENQAHFVVGEPKPSIFRSRKSAVYFAVAFGVLGGVFLFRSFAATPNMLFTDTTVPAVKDASDGQSVDVGVKFSSDVSGTISGIRFYKGLTNTGTHVGDLWTVNGTKLAEATFTNETAAGWQEVDFANPVAIQANTVYVASYFAPNGGYAYTYNGLTSAINSAPLHALANGASGSNGVYMYSNGPAFPTNGYRSSNYWVDVLFESKAVDTTPPHVTVTTPANNAVVSGLVHVTGNASDDTTVTSVQLSLDEQAPITIPITVGSAVAWDYGLDTSKLAQGSHTVKVTATDSAGITSTSSLTLTVSAPTGLMVDTQTSTHESKASTSITSAPFSTKYGNELLTAFLVSDGPNNGAGQTFSHVTGAGLTWTLKSRANTQAGDSEIWQAVAPNVITNATITASRASGSYVGSLTLTSFVNANTTTIPTATANATNGGPTVSLNVPSGAIVYGVGNDYDRAVARTVGKDQTMVDQYLANVGDTYWIQRQTAPTTAAGSVTLNDTAPTNDRWNFAAIAITPNTTGSAPGPTTDITPPTTPTNFVATAASATQVNLSWSASTDPDSPVSSYTIYRNGAQVGTASGTAFSDTNLAPNTTYTYYVTASDPSGNVSSPSSTVSVLTLAAPDTTPPSAPANVAATAASATQVNLSWSASTDPDSPIAKYLILRNGSVIATVASPTITYSDASAIANTQYGYQIEAQDPSGNTSNPSKTASITTPNPVDTTPPSVPTNVAAVAVSSSQVNLSWSASTDNIGVAGYTVYRNGVELGTTTTTSYGDATVNAGTSYAYSVSAYDGAGNHSTQSTAVNVTTPGSSSGSGLPTGVSLQSIDGGPAYFSKWSNSFPGSSNFVPVGVYPAEGQPAVLASEGLNFYTPSRNDNNGTWCPVWSNPNGNDMTAVNATSGFYAGGTFYQTLNGQAWGSHAAFDVFGDELDGNAGNFFDCLPSNVTGNNKAGSWGGLSANSFEAAEAASKSDDPTRPTYVQTTVTFIDGNQNYFYTAAEKQGICTGADIFSSDIYPIVLRGDPVWSMYDEVQEARGYCQDSRPVMFFTEMDHMNGGNVYPQPAQTTAEVWNAIIAGARGVQYFDQYGTIDNTTYNGNGHYAAGAMYNAIKNTNAQINQLAPVINASFANGYVTTNGTISVMAKYYNNHFYIFAIPHAGGTQNITFKLAGAPTTTATVLNENRTLTVTNGSFTDSFANENTVHIYEIN